MKQYFKLMRIHHWIKNLMVFLPLIFSGNLFDFKLIKTCVLAFFAFSMLSSAVYVINDITDVEKDRRHSTKRKRPIASGSVSIKSAIGLIVVLISIIAIITIFTFEISRFSWVFLLLYLIINIAYSMGLKKIPIIDITILSSGFILRLLYGSIITGIETSGWLYLTVLSMSFYLVLGKRRNEKRQQKDTREVLEFYNYEFLDKFMFLFLGLTITFYSLWATGFSITSVITSSYLIWTVPIVIIICMKYSLNLEKESEGDPVDVVLSDKLLLSLAGLYIIALAVIMYL